MTGNLILAAGDVELEIAPSVGGAIARFECARQTGRWSILRKPQGPLQHVLDAANFPLVPFVNRIRDGRFTFRGRVIRLSPNMEGDPSPLHGQGWKAPWRVESAGLGEAALVYLHDPGEWPWAYEARQRFRLQSGTLHLMLSCTNRSDEPMPCGLGQHPYFDCGPDTRIDTEVTHAWTVDEHVLPVEKVPATGRFDLSDRLVCGQDLDNGFGGWSGRARLSDPGWPFDLELSSSTARFFQLYSPEKGGIFVAEPVTHANDALSAPESQWDELGLRVLEPGQTMELEMRLELLRR